MTCSDVQLQLLVTCRHACANSGHKRAHLAHATKSLGRLTSNTGHLPPCVCVCVSEHRTQSQRPALPIVQGGPSWRHMQDGATQMKATANARSIVRRPQRARLPTAGHAGKLNGFCIPDYYHDAMCSSSSGTQRAFHTPDPVRFSVVADKHDGP